MIRGIAVLALFSFSFLASAISSAPALAASGTARHLPLTRINLRVGQYNPFEIASTLELVRYLDGEIEGVFLDAPPLPGVRDQGYNLREVMRSGQVTPFLEYPKGNTLKTFAFGVDSRFDPYSGGWAFITFKTAENGCRRLHFEVAEDTRGAPRIWVTYGAQAYSVTSIDIMTTLPRDVAVQKVNLALGTGTVKALPLAQLQTAPCP